MDEKNRFSNWRQWAPFVLIGDDVSFDFGKPSQAQAFFYFYYFNPNLNSIVTRLVVFVFHQLFPHSSDHRFSFFYITARTNRRLGECVRYV